MCCVLCCGGRRRVKSSVPFDRRAGLRADKGMRRQGKKPSGLSKDLLSSSKCGLVLSCCVGGVVSVRLKPVSQHVGQPTCFVEADAFEF